VRTPSARPRRRWHGGADIAEMPPVATKSLSVVFNSVQHTLEAPAQDSSSKLTRQPTAAAARLPIIDVARGSAALMVCALHAREIVWVGLRSCLSQRGHEPFFQTALGVLSAPLALGGTAVPLFFVISGYCIHRSFAAKLAADPDHEPHWRAYFIRRAWRIYPVLIAVLLITLLLDQFTVHRYPQDEKLGSLSMGTMLVNLCALQGLAGPPFGSNGPLWSLSVEMQLYALYPVIFYLVKRLGMKTSLLMTLAVSMVCAAVGAFSKFGALVWFGPFWFSWTLGCAVAELENSKIRMTLEPIKFIAWFLIGALGFALCLSRFSTFAFSCVACFWAVIILKCLRARVANSSLLPLTLMAKLGVISYSLYAVHKPVVLFARSLFFQATPSRNILFVPLVMAGCVLVASALFFLVERYSLRVPPWLRISSERGAGSCATAAE
jgi:peptidoglycan/LPS O-acetylase OafA/YrhL